MYTYITREQFFAWNPALDGNCLGLWQNYFYCVANFGADSPPPMPTVTVKPTANVAEGIVPECVSWYKVLDEDDTCDTLAEFFGAAFTRADFIRWNPTVLSDCSNCKRIVSHTRRYKKCS